MKATAIAHTVPVISAIFFKVFSRLSKPTLSSFVIMSSDGSPFLLDAVSDRFEVVLRRYQLFARDVPCRFQQWLKAAPSQKRVFASLDSICTELFPDLLSIVSIDFPQRWMLPVACVALKHHVTATMIDSVELSECGRALRVVDGFKSKKEYHTLADNTVLRSSLTDAICAASRTAALEVKVAEMECRSRGLLPANNRGIECKKRKLTGLEPVENTFTYLSECRAEALDALTALRKTRHKSKRQTEKLEAANAEISRLKEELAMRKQELSQQQQTIVVTYILPKRALSLAGFWNLSPNDLLCATPALIQAVERLGGMVIRRDGMQACFSSQDRALLVDAAVEIMATLLPNYTRRIEF